MIKPQEIHSVLDASKLQEYLKCPRMFLLDHVLNLKPDFTNHNLVFGSAWHEAKESLFLNGYSLKSVDQAFEKFLILYRQSFSETTDADFSGKSPGNAKLALTQYIKEYYHDNFEVVNTEIPASVSINDDRMIYSKLDSVMVDSRGYFSLESKTSGAAWSWWIDQWMLKLQIDIYTHVLYSCFEPSQVHGVIIDGTIFRKTSNEHLRVDCKRTPHHMENWLFEINRLYDKIEIDYANLYDSKSSEPYLKCFLRNPESCIQYNRICKYHDVCSAWYNPLQHLNELPSGFKIEIWDPRKKGE